MKFEIIHTTYLDHYYYVEAESEAEALRMWEDDEIGPYSLNPLPDHTKDSVDADVEINQLEQA
jgi:hypothetical protein